MVLLIADLESKKKSIRNIENSDKFIKIYIKNLKIFQLF